MENNNKNIKIISVIALLISILGLSLGFAAYTNIINIIASADYVADPTTTAAKLSTEDDEVASGPITPTTDGGATADNASLTDNSISNIVVHFTNSGQSATYTFYGYNDSDFVSYLNSVVFGTKTCTPGVGATASYVQNACDDITMTIIAGGNSYTATNANINGHSLASQNSEVIQVKIEYAAGGDVADGDFTVDFGTSALTYSTDD